MLRAVNVGGRTLAMKALQQLFAGLGYADAVTYIQSGNVVFTGPDDDHDAIADRIEQGLAADLGVPADVLLRTRAQLDQVVRANPFLESGADPARLHVTFLAGPSDPARAAAVDPTAFPPDEFQVDGREVYLHCPSGYGRSKLNNAFWERRLGQAATTRNWRTVTTLLGMASA